MVTTASFVLAISLSADAFAASLAKGAQFRHLSVRRSLLIAAGFALLEALTPLAGWLIGSTLGPWLAAVDHWVAFALLSVLGVRMLWSRAETGQESGFAASAAPGWAAIALAAMGTSVDGLAVGVTLALVMEHILPVLAVIALVTFTMVWIGLRIGHAAGIRIGRAVQTLGGIGLIAIGTKILLEHVLAS